MAKVSTIKFDFKGVASTINVNCTSGGEFNCNLPEEISEALRVSSKLTANTLSALEKSFFDALKKYKEAETKEELFILIAYFARGHYAQNKKGDILFGGYRHKYELQVNFSRPRNALGLDFMVAIKQTIDKKDKWFAAKLGKDCSWIQEKEYSQPDVYHKQEEIHHPSEYKQIPFSPIALESLKTAEEKLRTASEMLFHFIEQDEEKILLTLTNQKLLT